MSSFRFDTEDLHNIVNELALVVCNVVNEIKPFNHDLFDRFQDTILNREFLEKKAKEIFEELCNRERFNVTEVKIMIVSEFDDILILFKDYISLKDLMNDPLKKFFDNLREIWAILRNLIIDKFLVDLVGNPSIVKSFLDNQDMKNLIFEIQLNNKFEDEQEEEFNLFRNKIQIQEEHPQFDELEQKFENQQEERLNEEEFKDAFLNIDMEDLLNFQENKEEFFNESENMTNNNDGFDEEDEETFATFTFKQDVENFVIQTELHHPIFKFYLEICKEIVTVYSDEEIQPSDPLKQIFGEQLEIQPILEKFEGNATYPIPSNKITNLIGTNDHYFNRKFMRIRNGKDVYFKFEKLIDIKARLIAAFSTKTASRIVGNYLNAKGARYSLIFSIVEIFYKHTKTYFGTKKISLIIYGKNYTIDDLLKTDYDILQALNPLWRFEYYIYKLKTKKNIGFNVDQNTLEKIQRDCIQEIHNHISKNFQIVNPAGFIMIWECLYALSNIREESEPISIQDLSEMIAPLDYKYKRQYLIKRYVNYGFDFYSYIAEALLTVIALKVPDNHQVLQYIKDYLETNRRISPIDIEALFKNAIMPSNRTTKLSPFQRNVMIRIVWDLACERDWMTGTKIPREWALLHHIRHDPATGFTIHSDNRLVNFACLTKNDNIDNNIRVEKNWKFWERNFIISWEYLRNGKAPPHWSEEEQRKFKKERNSKNYLDNWIDVLENYDIF